MAGPKDNPFKTIAGVTPCPGGWLVLPGRIAGVTVVAEEAFVLRKLAEVLDHRPSFDFAGVNIPFGYPEYPNVQYRTADRAARAMMGWPNRVRVRPVPSRAELDAVGATVVVTARPSGGGVRRRRAVWRSRRPRPGCPPAHGSRRRSPRCEAGRRSPAGRRPGD